MRWAALVLLLIPAGLPAQTQTYRLMGLELGRSTKEDVRRVFGLPVTCPQMPVAVDGVEICFIPNSPRGPEFVFNEGRLRGLRALYPRGTDTAEKVRDLNARFGVGTLEHGEGSTRDLRYWAYPLAENGHLLLAEVRNTETGERRLRLIALDRRGGWSGRLAEAFGMVRPPSR